MLEEFQDIFWARLYHQPDCKYAWGRADALHLCGLCHQKLNEPDLARRRLEAAVNIRQKIQHPGLEETKKLLENL